MTDTLKPSRQIELLVRDLGRIDYAGAYDLQRRLQAEVIAARDHDSGASRMHLLLLEHDPAVITVSRRRGARAHLVATPRQLAAAGVEVAETDRGGDITYHGPGQLVAYAILDLNVLALRLHGYMRLLEQAVIDVLEHFGIRGTRDETATGVWVDSSSGPEHPRGQETAGVQPGCGGKICALGVRVSRWVSMHGLALNVTTNLDHFDLIVPCGLAGRSVTSMERELDSNCPSMEEVKHVLGSTFAQALCARVVRPG